MMDDVREKEAQAIAAENSGDFDTAIQIWEQILHAYPRWEHGVAHYNLAGCYEETGQIDLAIETYRKAITLSPNDPMFSETLESLLEARKLGHI
jgi:tetratricopeptide (TPR) repeat protein